MKFAVDTNRSKGRLDTLRKCAESGMLKQAKISWGDILNAGMAPMGAEPMAPRLFKPGVKGAPQLKPTAEIQRDQFNTAVGGSIGLGLGLGLPYAPAAAKIVASSIPGAVTWSVADHYINPQPTEEGVAREMLSQMGLEGDQAQAGAAQPGSVMSFARRHPYATAAAVGIPALGIVSAYILRNRRRRKQEEEKRRLAAR